MEKENLKQPQGGHADGPVPDHIQIQTITGCNANCVFCPNGKTSRRIPGGRRMDWDLYRSIVDQSIAMGIRRYSVYLMNEPMLDPELPQRIEYICARIKKPQYVKITSHGGLLTERLTRGLLDSGLKKLKISVHSLNPTVYRDIMGLDLAKTLRNIDRFLALKNKGGYKLPRLEIVMVDPGLGRHEISTMQRYWHEREIKLNIEVIENRAGQQNIREMTTCARKMKFFSWCRRLMEHIFVLHNGRMVQCCADWEQRSIMGDLTREALANIWYGERYTAFRSRFDAGDVKEMICVRCFKQALQN